MFKIFILFNLLLITNLSNAQCLSGDMADYSLKWEAFKTSKKIGVEGEFQKIIFKNFKANSKFNTELKGAEFEISTKSIFTNNESRDENLKSHFFDFDKITAIIKKIEKEYILIDVLINNKLRSVALKYKIEDSVLTATGFIDIFDFNLSKQLIRLNKECFALHEGKTWSDVKISLKVVFKACK